MVLEREAPKDDVEDESCLNAAFRSRHRRNRSAASILRCARTEGEWNRKSRSCGREDGRTEEIAEVKGLAATARR